MTADLRAFWAATKKEWRSQLRYPMAFVSMLFWPLALPGIYVLQAYAFAGGSQAALHAFGSRTGTYSIAGFIYAGWSMYMWLSTVLWGPGTALRQQQVEGQLEAIFTTPAARAAVLFGPVGTGLVVALWMFGVVGLVIRVGFGVPIDPGEALQAMAVLAVGTPAIYGLGMLFSVAVLVIRENFGLVQMVRGLFTVLCGMSFPIAVLPGWARDIALALPPTYIIADVRQVLLAGSSLAAVRVTLGVLAASGVVLCLAAAFAFRAAEHRARAGGGFAQY